MIARLWHGSTPVSRSQAYLDFLLKTGVPDYRKTPGNRGVQILLRQEEDVAHFLLISLWDSMEAVGRFAGPDVDRAKYYPEDPQFLLELETTVVHYEVAHSV
ncbi:MAG: antibiotic biosynthesis monooxygenase [Gammaproteobacteria bacterium RBG_16_66_13]|nr:MAG: antibiotic biosynthesis monooxygenase [Gammaproteobacteria bacterium RBG_16_66_13]